MSKLEEALRKASQGHEKSRRHGPSDGSGNYRPADSQSLLAPVLYRLQATLKHVPDADALERHSIIHDGYSDEALNNYKMLRTRILQEYNSKDLKTLAITAPHDGAGKTVIAINLAITLASHGGHEIFLVDLDMRNPAIANYLDLPPEVPGLRAYLDENADLTNVLWDVGVENLAVLANRESMSNSSERIMSNRMLAMINTFKSASPKPIVIFDLPPVLTVDDAVAMSPIVDGMLMVAAEGETPREDLAQGLDLLRDANVLGVVLNKSGRR